MDITIELIESDLITSNEVKVVEDGDSLLAVFYGSNARRNAKRFVSEYLRSRALNEL